MLQYFLFYTDVLINFVLPALYIHNTSLPLITFLCKNSVFENPKNWSQLLKALEIIKTTFEPNLLQPLDLIGSSEVQPEIRRIVHRLRSLLSRHLPNHVLKTNISKCSPAAHMQANMILLSGNSKLSPLASQGSHTELKCHMEVGVLCLAGECGGTSQTNQVWRRSLLSVTLPRDGA